MDEQVSRRQFLNMNIKAANGFLSQFIIGQFENKRDFFRPPGVEDELSFLASCSRCGLCQDACPQKMIHFFSADAGAKLVYTPYTDPNQQACTFCGDCARVCPTGALELAAIVARNPIGKAVINEQHCIAHKQIMCDYCVRACPEQALFIKDGLPVIDEAACTGCGLCVTGCIEDKKGIVITCG